MNTVERLRGYTAAQDKTAQETAKELGVTEQYVRHLCKKHGIKLRSVKKYVVREWKNHFGGAKKLTSHFIGGASELIVAADFLRKGIPVYRAVTFQSAADLVVDIEGTLWRVEVKSAKRNGDGHLRYQVPADASRYDILALVEPNSDVTFKPDLATFFTKVDKQD